MWVWSPQERKWPEHIWQRKPWKVDMSTHTEDEGAKDRTLENVCFREVDGRRWSSKMGWKDDLEAETEPGRYVVPGSQWRIFFLKQVFHMLQHGWTSRTLYIVLNEISQSRKDECCTMSLIWELLSVVKITETKSRMMFPRCWGEGAMGSCCLMSSEFQFYKIWKEFWKLVEQQYECT